VNRQSEGEKLKYVLKLYLGGTHHVISRMRNDDLRFSIVSMSPWCLGRNISETVRDARTFQGDVTWPWKVKVVTPIHLNDNISETAWD